MPRLMLRLTLRLKRVLPLALTVLLTTLPAAYGQSAPVKVKVGDAEYNVTPMSAGRMLRVDDLDGHLIGMARVDGANLSVLAPQDEPGFSIVKGAANAYLHPANGAAPPAPADPMAARRAAAQARMAAMGLGSTAAPGGASGGTPGGAAGASAAAPAERTVTFPPAGGAVVKDPDLNVDVTFTADGTMASFVRQGHGPMGAVSEKITASFEGGDQPASGGADAARAVGSVAKATVLSYDPYVRSRIGGSSEIWKVSQSTNGGKASTLYESGGYTMSETGRYPEKSLAMPVLISVKKDWEAVETQAATAKQAGQTVQIDFSGDRSQRAKAALDKAVTQ
jgi:hypothetical protein